MFYIFRYFYRLIFEFRHEIIVITLLLVVCSIPFWPLILDNVGIHTIFLSTNAHNEVTDNASKTGHGSWLVSLMKNLIGYASIFVPIYLISIYLHKIRYDEISGSGRIAQFIRACLFDSSNSLPTVVKTGGIDANGKHRGYLQRICSPMPGSVDYYGLMCASAIGLQVSYLVWGVLQERIMTRSYNGELFDDSQFLVFINRLLAGLLAIIVLVVAAAIDPTDRDKTSAPLFKYCYSSISNILSSWCQYEALKFVSFPVQILAKASKIIPVMLMGKLVKKQTYRWDEYITAGVISMGVTLFLLDTNSHKSQPTTPQTIYNPISGMILLVCYMLFDSFTSNWQERLFKTYKVNSFQMMAGVNIWSCFFTIASLIEQGTLLKSLEFGFRHWDFLTDAVVLSVCSATGQVFIFFTIQKFGAVVFIIIMTMRQAIAILLSCLIYGHPVHMIGVVGILTVFVSLFCRIYLSFILKSKFQSQ